MSENKKSKKRRRVVGKGALRRDPTSLALASYGPEDGLFLDRRSRPREQSPPEEAKIETE